jgi:hypothetical protein
MPEKALSGEVQMVWADDSGGWVCERTGDEHKAAHDLTPFEVEFTVVVHVLAPNDDEAYTKAEAFATEAAATKAWDNYDDCVRSITKEEF